MLIAIPCFKISAMVGIDRGRAWSVIDELLLWAMAQKPASVRRLADESGLHRRVVVSSIARMMRFRLVELKVTSEGPLFQASGYGAQSILSGRPLPFFPTRETKRTSFIVERATGSFFPSAQARLVHEKALANVSDDDVRTIAVEGGGPTMTHDANFTRLAQIATRSWEEQLAVVDARTATIQPNFMLIRVVDGVPRNIPDGASPTLRKTIDIAISKPAGVKQIVVGYGGPPPAPEVGPKSHKCYVAPDDIIIGGEAQAECLHTLIEQASSRAIIHSTFLDRNKFKALMPLIRTACMRGVRFDLLYGADKVDEEETKNSAEAVEIAKLVRNDRDIARKFHVHMRSTGSHAKILLADNDDGDWIAAVGSCNWLSTPFKSVELSVVLRDPGVVADVATAIQKMVDRRGLLDDLASEMALTAKDLRRIEPQEGEALVSLVTGDSHDILMRTASGSAARRMLVGSHRLGTTARPNVVIPGEAAVDRAEIRASLIYTRPSGPLKSRHARTLKEEAAANGFRLIKAENPDLHGKFLIWDDDDVVITSLNWASATTHDDFPLGDIGVHICSPGIAEIAAVRLAEIYPSLAQDQVQGTDS
jgi:cardiolipin synthase